VSRVALLDVNLLIALFDPDHVHHDLAHDWFDANRRDGWATSPLTENAFLRILSNPAYGLPLTRVASLARSLATFCKSGHHHFWPDEVSLRDAKLFDLALTGHRYLTDVYLLGLAKKMGGRLATFDRTIPAKAVIGAGRETLAVIAPVDSDS
jgi:toxin-antitoxin system PIN domain toxin